MCILEFQIPKPLLPTDRVITPYQSWYVFCLQCFGPKRHIYTAEAAIWHLRVPVQRFPQIGFSVYRSVYPGRSVEALQTFLFKIGPLNNKSRILKPFTNTPDPGSLFPVFEVKKLKKN